MDSIGGALLGADGDRVVGHIYRAWLKRLGERVFGRGLRIAPHLLRHACAVYLLRGRADIRIVQALLGHLDLNTTKIYLRLLPDDLRTEYAAAMPVLMSGEDIARIAAPA